jgi:hypothetical protein
VLKRDYDSAAEKKKKKEREREKKKERKKGKEEEGKHLGGEARISRNRCSHLQRNADI